MSQQKAIKEFVYIRYTRYYNDNNIAYLATFWSEDGKVLNIEEEQYDAWADTDALDMLKVEFDVINRVKDVKHFPKDMLNVDLPDWYYKVYNTILSRATADRWIQLINDGFVVPIPKTENDEVDRTQLSKDIQSVLDTIKNKQINGWFTKCSTCSTKHDYPPEPVFSGAEAVTHLLGSSKVNLSINQGKSKHVLLRPWLINIEDNNELRVFVRKGNVVGVSQQACYKTCAILNMYNEQDVIDACQKCYDDFNGILPEKHRFNYECTFDAYISTKDDGDIDVNLIEINSEMFGWGPAGSSLFSWIYNPPPQVGEPPKYMIVGAM
jgi:hypothetical protein